MPSKTDNFDDRLESEDYHKEYIQHVKDIGHRLSLTVMIDGHLNHVEEDDDNDAELKLAAVGDVVEDSLQSILGKREIK